MQTGLQDVVFSAADGVSISTMTVRLSVPPDRASACTTLSLATFKREFAPLLARWPTCR